VGSKKYLSSGQLFDLAHDPEEQRPLPDPGGSLAALLAAGRSRHLQAREQLSLEEPGATDRVVPRHVEPALRALGYL
jgi:hypothetical protein